MIDITCVTFAGEVGSMGAHACELDIIYSLFVFLPMCELFSFLTIYDLLCSQPSVSLF